jgi:hypothetical protein
MRRCGSLGTCYAAASVGAMLWSRLPATDDMEDVSMASATPNVRKLPRRDTRGVFDADRCKERREQDGGTRSRGGNEASREAVKCRGYVQESRPACGVYFF